MEKQKELPKISEAEWEVMETLWRSSPLSAQEIIEQLDHKDWNPKTVKTLLFRLEKKAVIGHRCERREYYYHPLIEKEKYIKTESQGFLRKIFNGSATPMMLHFIKSQKLSKKELKEIKELIQELEENL